MASTEQKLELPKPEISPRTAVRLGAGVITGDFPVLKRPTPEISPRSAVRLGAGVITGDFPV